MIATKKMDGLGMKALLALIEPMRPGLALETLYRWRQALNTGKGISDANKQLLVAATKTTDAPILWADFEPNAEANADVLRLARAL